MAEYTNPCDLCKKRDDCDIECVLDVYSSKYSYLQYDCLFRQIDEVITNSRSKIARENGFGIAVGLQLLQSYLKSIAERAIELNDDELIDMLIDLHVLKEEDDNEK